MRLQPCFSTCVRAASMRLNSNVCADQEFCKRFQAVSGWPWKSSQRARSGFVCADWSNH